MTLAVKVALNPDTSNQPNALDFNRESLKSGHFVMIERLTFTSSKNQPNPDPDNHEDCLALNGAYDFGWHDGYCADRIGYPLCEKT